MIDLNVIGTLGILFEAGRRGPTDFPQAILDLRRVGFRASPLLVAALLSEHEKHGRLYVVRGALRPPRYP